MDFFLSLYRHAQRDKGIVVMILCVLKGWEGLNLWCSQTFQKQLCVPYPIYSGSTFPGHPCALFCDYASHFLRANYIDSVSSTLLEVKGSRLSLVACAILNVLVGFARGLLAGCPGNGS